MNKEMLQVVQNIALTDCILKWRNSIYVCIGGSVVEGSSRRQPGLVSLLMQTPSNQHWTSLEGYAQNQNKWENHADAITFSRFKIADLKKNVMHCNRMYYVIHFQTTLFHEIKMAFVFYPHVSHNIHSTSFIADTFAEQHNCPLLCWGLVLNKTLMTVYARTSICDRTKTFANFSQCPCFNTKEHRRLHKSNDT